MEIAVSSKSFVDDVLAYAASRLVVGRIVLLWLAVAACALIVSREISAASAILVLWLSAILIAQFRLWDDLADRAHDAATHPQRVIVTTNHARRFSYLCGLLSLPVAATLGRGYGIEHLAVYVGLLVFMSVLYAANGTVLPSLLRAHLVLLKYPAFIWLCALNADLAQWARVGTAAYLALCIFEMASDADLRGKVVWRGMIAVEALAIAVLLIFISRVSQ